MEHRNSSLKSQHHNLPLKGPTALKLSTMFQLCSGKETINSSLRDKKPSQFQLIFFPACSRLMSSGWFIHSFINGDFSSPALGHLYLKSLLSVFRLGWNKQVHKCTVELINEWIFQYLIRPSVYWPAIWHKFSKATQSMILPSTEKPSKFKSLFIFLFALDSQIPHKVHG